jgi:plastocyanin domain-containing protein
MEPSQIFVTIAGAGAIALVVWFFFMSERASTRALVGAGGLQEIDIVVKGGYTPDTIVVQKGRPVRLNFDREETASCSDTVVFGDFGIARPLPAFKTTPIEFTPDKVGEFTFTCGMNMLRGKLIVEEPDGGPDGNR